MNTQEMAIDPINTAHQDHSIEVEFQLNTQRYQIYFCSNDVILTGNLESFLASALLPCMKNRGTILVKKKEEVSRRYISGIGAIQDIYCSWDSSLRRVEIQNIISLSRDSSKEGRIGTFFSGGVDSFYTFLKHRDKITDLIFVHGFDMAIDDTSLRGKTSERLRKVASSFGKNFIEIETNLRSLLDPYVNWGCFAHGAALSAIGHLLFPLFSRIFIPATHTYAALFPWGSHPLLDPLWSSETLEFVHDGCEATRIDKVALLSECDIALQNLRVCFENHNGAYNCGRCEKCIRTMINLHVVGALERCPTFDLPLDIKRVMKIKATDINTRAFVMENLKALENNPANTALGNALRQVLNRPQWPSRIKKRLKKTSIYPMLRRFHPSP